MIAEILILAAGSSSRMRGGDKLLEPVDGQPLLARITAAALATGCPVTVALPPDRPAREDCLRGMGLRRVTVPDPQLGMAASLRAGLAALPRPAPLLLLLADLPEITAEDLRAVLAAWRETPDALLRGATADGRAGHPVGFPPDLWPELLQLSGDQGAREVVARHKDRLRLLPLPGQHATTDLDTPEDWANWRAGR